MRRSGDHVDTVSAVRRFVRVAWRLCSWIAVIVAIGGWFVFLRPPAIGGTTGYVFIKGDSMQPTYHTGDLVIVRQKASYDIGDVAAFRVMSPSGPTIVIHRVKTVNPDGTHILRGDNRDADDPWHPTNEEIVGSPIGIVPRLGTAVGHLAARPLLLALICAAIAGLAVAGAPESVGRRGRRLLRA